MADIPKFMLVEENHGAGEKEWLNRAKLQALQRVCDKFRKMVVDDCEEYALYRCTFTGNAGIIYAVMSGSKYDGNLSKKELQLAYDTTTGETYTNYIRLKNEKAICKELYNVVTGITKLVPYVVGMLDIPLEGKFEKGFRMDYNKEVGTSLIIVKDSLDTDYFLG